MQAFRRLVPLRKLMPLTTLMDGTFPSWIGRLEQLLFMLNINLTGIALQKFVNFQINKTSFVAAQETGRNRGEIGLVSPI